MSICFSNRMKGLNASEIREILKITQRPDIISFAGGLPAPELFPVEELKKVSSYVLENLGEKALQYSTTEGYIPLREKIAARMNHHLKTSLNSDNILILSGSQQGLDFSGKLFIDKGDVILCESPTYLGAINAFKAYEPNIMEIETDEEGMIPEALETLIIKTPNIKFIYVIPDFQNPTGRTWSYKRRLSLMSLAEKYMIPIVEDNPYGELRFEGEELPSLKSLDKKGIVIYLGTFSKIFCPGLLIGWVACNKDFFEKFVLLKQGCDLQTSTRSQIEVSYYMDTYSLDENIAKIKNVYRKRRNIMLKTMDEEFPDNIIYTRPRGGLFTWVTLPSYIDSKELLKICLENQVAFVPGESFFPSGGKKNFFRMNYSNMPEERIVEGIKRIGKILKKMEELNFASK